MPKKKRENHKKSETPKKKQAANASILFDDCRAVSPTDPYGKFTGTPARVLEDVPDLPQFPR